MNQYKYLLIFVLVALIGARCSFFSISTIQTLTPTATFSPTHTPTPTITFTPTLTPTKTLTPTPTPPTLLILKRPVSIHIPLYHIYGYIKNSLANFTGFHDGYDYGFLNCNPIVEPIFAPGPGIVIKTYVDDNLRPGAKNGGLWIDHGIHTLADGKVMHIVSRYDHVVPAVTKGLKITDATIVANFSTCERYGYYPELHITINAIEPNKTKNLDSDELSGYIVELLNDKNLIGIDPILVGLEPK